MTIITTQSEANKFRSGLDICYLCGELMSSCGPTSREHIIPKAILGSCPSPMAWTPVVDVHRSCECREKRPLDEVYSLFQKFTFSTEKKMSLADEAMDRVFDLTEKYEPDSRRRSVAAERFAADTAFAASSADFGRLAQKAIDRYVSSLHIPEKERASVRNAVALLLNHREALTSGHYRKTALKPVEDVITDGPTIPPHSFPLDGFNDIKSAVWNWVRGFHALIYGEHLPHSTGHNLWTPDVSAFIGMASPKPASDSDSCDIIQHWLHVAELTKKADGILYWGETCKFRCGWLYIPEIASYSRCLWSLDVPPNSQEIKVWYGWYYYSMPPERAKVLTQSDVAIARDQFKKRLVTLRGISRITTLI